MGDLLVLQLDLGSGYGCHAYSYHQVIHCRAACSSLRPFREIHVSVLDSLEPVPAHTRNGRLAGVGPG